LLELLLVCCFEIAFADSSSFGSIDAKASDTRVAENG
jgi:hypothetical protein